jgi:dTDP-4-amino-4,6-dideoxygalactose transaminase
VLALKAFDVGPGDEVIVPPFTFGATAGAVAWAGATPVFADIDPETLNIDPSAVETAITSRTKAVIAVHLFGLPAPMDRLRELTSERGIALIEDAAQAILAEQGGRRAGSMGDIACLSFYPTKNLGAYGDGGMVLCSSPDLHEKLGWLRAHGSVRRYIYDHVGTNSRLDEMQAAILRRKLTRLEEWTEARRRNAGALTGSLGDLEEVRAPVEPPGSRHVYHLYTIRVADPDGLGEALGRAGVATGRYYPAPLHLMPAFSDNHEEGDFPVSEAAARSCLALPVHPALTLEAVDEIALAVRSALTRHEA